jgi:hypothetical protein
MDMTKQVSFGPVCAPLALILAGLGTWLLGTGAMAAEPTGGVSGGWIDLRESMPPDCQRAEMIAVDPTTGNLYLYAGYPNWKAKLQISKDQGATWSNIPCPVTGNTGGVTFAFNMDYPFTGRMCLFAGDGHAGITFDGGATWQKFDVTPHSLQYGDVDWGSPAPSLMIDNSWVAANGNALSPAVSTDLGQTWTIAPPMPGVFGPKINSGGAKVGIFDAQTLLMANNLSKGVLVSHDLGKTWTKTADFSPLGTNPVHYGKHLYWTAAQGVMTTENGSDWKLLGTALPNAHYGPYFGPSEAQMMVVTEAGVFLTADAAKTWNKVGGFPKVSIKGHNVTGTRFAWDPVHNLVYAILGEGVWRLQVK